MGTYSTTSDNAEGKRESEYLRWRYFAEETTEYVAGTETTEEVLAEGTHYDFDPNTRPTGNGYFILETYIDAFDSTGVNGINCSWNNDYKYSSPYDHQLNGLDGINANDYSTSTIRQYMNSTGDVYKSYSFSFTSSIIEDGIYLPSGTQSNMFTDLHIDPENDIVYNHITARTLGDLYSNMYQSTSGGSVTFPDLSGAREEYRFQETDSDKFWLLSYYEAYNLLSGNATDSPDTDREWGNLYWLRSPAFRNASTANLVDYDGNLYNGYIVSLQIYAARAAFKFSVDNIA